MQQERSSKQRVNNSNQMSNIKQHPKKNFQGGGSTNNRGQGKNTNQYRNNSNRYQKSPPQRSSPKNISNQKRKPNYNRRPKQFEDNPKSFSDVLADLTVKFILNCPEEEHESFDRLFFQIEEAFWFYLDFYRDNDPSLPKLTLHEFSEHIFAQCPYLKPFQPQVQQHIESFIQYKSSVPVCGSIILSENLDKVLLVKGWNSKSWNFPRGKINKDEDEVTCAIRETQEEVGFDCSKLIYPEHYLESHFNDQALKLFFVPGVYTTTKFQPQTRKEISEIAWFSVVDIIDKKVKGNFWPIKPYILRIHQWIIFYQGNFLQDFKQPKYRFVPNHQAKHRHKIYRDNRGEAVPAPTPATKTAPTPKPTPLTGPTLSNQNPEKHPQKHIPHISNPKRKPSSPPNTSSYPTFLNNFSFDQNKIVA